jgi:hypothetical protein
MACPLLRHSTTADHQWQPSSCHQPSPCCSARLAPCMVPVQNIFYAFPSVASSARAAVPVLLLVGDSEAQLHATGQRV